MGSHDVAQIQIRVDGGYWDNVANSGSRAVNTGAYNKQVKFEARSLNSQGTAGAVASTSAKSGDAPPPPPPPKTEWTVTVGGGGTDLDNGHRTCMENANGSSDNYDNGNMRRRPLGHLGQRHRSQVLRRRGAAESGTSRSAAANRRTTTWWSRVCMFVRREATGIWRHTAPAGMRQVLTRSRQPWLEYVRPLRKVARCLLTPMQDEERPRTA